jgi:hypothetical protein
VLAATSIGLAVAEWMGRITLRVEPRIMLLLAALFVGRVLVRRRLQGREQQRQMMLKEVPKRPLGLDEEEKR